jgi:hypothetical protein
VADAETSLTTGRPRGKGSAGEAGVSAEGSVGFSFAPAGEPFAGELFAGELFAGELFAAAAFAGGAGVRVAGLSFPWDRNAAARVMSRAPQPGQAMMLSGPKDWVIADLQRGQFMALDRGREYNVR